MNLIFAFVLYTNIFIAFHLLLLIFDHIRIGFFSSKTDIFTVKNNHADSFFFVLMTITHGYNSILVL
jgi:hypothetical protein